MTRVLKVGFIPLIDCAALAVAREKGFAASRGLDLTLSREASWSAIRDKVGFGLLDAAHMLAPMPLAMSLGLGGGITVPMTVPMSLGLGGNAITVSTALHDEMCAADPAAMAGERGRCAQALAAVIAARRQDGRPQVRLAFVFAFSSHNYELRYWLAAAGIDPDRDVQMQAIPPERMVRNLENGQIDGFCVGEPWNQLAVSRGLGRVVATKSDIWPSSPEKVLGLRRDWADREPQVVLDLVAALVEAARWADQPDNRAELADILARPDYVGVAAAVLQPALQGVPWLDRQGPVADLPDYHAFFRSAATFPWLSHAQWLLAQMIRWGQLEPTRADAARREAEAVFRPDLYARAVAPLGIAVPCQPSKVEGAHQAPYAVEAHPGGTLELAADAIFDGYSFDPMRFDDYLAKGRMFQFVG